MALKTDIAIKNVRLKFKDQPFRIPLKFGTGVLRSLTLLTAAAEVENGRGARATGMGNVLLSHLWAYPDDRIPRKVKDKAMRQVAERYARLVEGMKPRGHPIDLFMRTEEELFAIAREVSPDMPRLAALVAASPIDCAVHDGFGRVNGMCSYAGYGKEACEYDLSRYLGKGYRGRYAGEFPRDQYAPSLPVFHLVGGLDQLRREDSPAQAPPDSPPNSLDEWIRTEGIYCFKLKLRGNELEWDLDRCKAVAAVAGEERVSMGSGRFYFSIDTNECCESPEYCLELLERLRAEDPDIYEAILYLEQPTGRDLSVHDHDMRALASLKPVLADEAVTTIADLERAVELGWSGIALKTCKCLSPSLLYVAKAEKEGLRYSVQDLTNPGYSLVQSVGFAARINPILGVECNSRQFIPSANRSLMAFHRDLVEPRHGRIATDSLHPHGLGCHPDVAG